MKRYLGPIIAPRTGAHLDHLVDGAEPYVAAGDVFHTDDERQRARRYSRARRRLAIASMLWTSLLSALALATGGSAWLRDRVVALAPHRLGPAIPYVSAATILSALASLPLSYFGGYRLERRYGLANQGTGAWLVEQAKQLAVGLALTAPLAQGAYAVIRRYPRRWWAILSGLTAPFAVALSFLAPVLILPLFNRYQPLRDRALANRIKDLAEREGIRVADVVEMDMSRQTNKANAFFTGIGRTRRIALGDTLLRDFSPDEIEVVMAHELGHQVHRDLWKGIGVGTAFTVLGFYLEHRLAPPLIARVGPRCKLDVEQGAGDVAALPLLALLLGGVTLALAPLRNAFSRVMVERAADRYALELTGNASAFIGAMEKLGRMNLAEPNPPALVKYLFYTHPPIGERIADARRWAGGRKKTVACDPEVQAELERLVEPLARGDPESPLRWTCKSVRNLAAELRARGHRVSHSWVAGLLHERGYSLQGNRKTREGGRPSRS